MVYLDNAATTKPNEKIFNKNAEICLNEFYNPSALYNGGINVLAKIKSARKVFTDAFSGFKIAFTSCGTEADNTAVFGFFKRGNGVTTSGEHPAVFQCFEALKQKGLDVRYAPLNLDGSVNVEKLIELVDENTTFLSVVHVNNETGAINDINKIARLAKAKAPRLVFHSDGVQAFGKINYKPSRDIDLYSVSAHKIGALKGCGALFYKSGLFLPPYLYGGGQEEGKRSGTENVLGILTFSDCFKECLINIEENLINARQNKEAFLNTIDKDKILVVSSENSSPYVISILCAGLKGEVLSHMLEEKGYIVGKGSACSSKNPHSRVLSACGYNAKQLDGALRISFSFETKTQDVVGCAKALNECVKSLYGVIYR